jgi:hypothetical protein
MPPFRARYGPWAVVVGASEGIGAALAEELAARGLDLLLVARRPGPLEALAASLAARHGVAVRALAVDAGSRAGLDAIRAELAAREVGLLVMSAALAPVGDFLSITPDEHERVLDINCRAAVVLLRALAPAMVARGRGGVVLMSSLASLQGTATVAHYAATKAYLRVLAEGLWDELRPRGVDVVACLAGPTRTPTWLSARPRPSRLAPPVLEPRAVGVAALDGLGRGPIVVPGAANRAVAALMRHLPARAAVRLVSDAARRLYGAS